MKLLYILTVLVFLSGFAIGKDWGQKKFDLDQKDNEYDYIYQGKKYATVKDLIEDITENYIRNRDEY